MPLAEIADPKNDYNLNIPRYIDSSEPEDIQDLHAHLHGGIPVRDIDALAAYWDAFPSLRTSLFQPDRPGYLDLAVPMPSVQQVILDAQEFKRFSAQVLHQFAAWFGEHRPALAAIDQHTRPNDLIACISDDLLARFVATPLLDEYDIYEQLMSYWHDTMHDDVTMIMIDGWRGAARPRLTIEDKERKLTEMPDLVLGSGRNATKYKMDLIPPSLIVNRYFAADQQCLDELNARAEEATRAVEEYTEEHAVEDGLLAAAMGEDKISKSLTAARLREAKREGTDPEEVEALQYLIKLYDAEAAAKRAVKEAQTALDEATLKQYGRLTESEIQTLVLDDKWCATVASQIGNEVTALTLTLVGRIRQLGERYSETVGEIEVELLQLEAKVVHHLLEMGVK